MSGVGNLNYSTMADKAQKKEVNKTDASYQGKDLHVSQQPILTEEEQLERQEEIKKQKKIRERERIKRQKIKERERFLAEARGELIEDDNKSETYSD